MEATTTDILRFLQRPQQFFVPIFQRRYSWTKRNCQQLLDDVLRVGEDHRIREHFLGSIVYMEENLQPIGGPIPKYLVVDGQQRLTTLTLLISALIGAINEEDNPIPITPRQLSNYYLLNHEEVGESRYKLILNQSDKDTLIHLLGESPLPTNPSPVLMENYRFFQEQIGTVNLEVLYEGLKKLTIVSIALDRTVDNPQMIFESLNSTGLSLAEVDRIRNYVLMGQEPEVQQRLYEKYWFPMENRFERENYTKRFDRFMRDYLTLKSETGNIPNIGKVHEEFKVQYPVHEIGDPASLEAHLEDISRYAGHFVDITQVDITQGPQEEFKLRECLRDFVELHAEVAYPFLLEVYDDYKNGGHIEKAEVIKILRLVESYVFRRFICDLPTNTLNTTFATLMGHVDKSQYVDSLSAVFSAMTDRRRFPKHAEFKEAFKTIGVYNIIPKRRRYLLHRLEEFDHNEPVRGTRHAITIEHIMPQTLTEAWENELGEEFQRVHDTWLHTIGNLTLTGYNSEYSNRPFIEKRDMPEVGLRYSPLHLNQGFAEIDTWNEAAIKERAERLAERACRVWMYPENA